MSDERIHRVVYVESSRSQHDIHSIFSRYGKINAVYPWSARTNGNNSAFFLEFADENSVKRACALALPDISLRVAALSSQLTEHFKSFAPPTPLPLFFPSPSPAPAPTAHAQSAHTERQVKREPREHNYGRPRRSHSPTWRPSDALSGESVHRVDWEQSKKRVVRRAGKRATGKRHRDAAERLSSQASSTSSSFAPSSSGSNMRQDVRWQESSRVDSNKENLAGAHRSVAAHIPTPSPSIQQTGVPASAEQPLASHPSLLQRISPPVPSPSLAGVDPAAALSSGIQPQLAFCHNGEGSPVDLDTASFVPSNLLAPPTRRYARSSLPRNVLSSSPVSDIYPSSSPVPPSHTSFGRAEANTGNSPLCGGASASAVASAAHMPPVPLSANNSHSLVASTPAPIPTSALIPTSISTPLISSPCPPHLLPASPSIVLAFRGERVTVDLASLEDDPAGIIAVLRATAASALERDKWMIVAAQYRGGGRVRAAIGVVEAMVGVMTDPAVGMKLEELKPALLMLASCHRDLARHMYTSDPEKSAEHTTRATLYLQQVYGANPTLTDRASKPGSEYMSEVPRPRTHLANTSNLPSQPSLSAIHNTDMKQQRQLGDHANEHVQKLEREVESLRAHQVEHTQIRTAKRQLEDELRAERHTRQRLEHECADVREQCAAEAAKRKNAEAHAEQAGKATMQAEERARRAREDVVRVRDEMERRMEEMREGEKRARACFGRLGVLFMRAAGGEGAMEGTRDVWGAVLGMDGDN